MDAAQQPAAGHFILDVIDALPGRLRTQTVRHPKKEAGQELDGKAKDKGAAPDIAPTHASRDVFVEGILDDTPVAGAAVEPIEQCFHDASRVCRSAGVSPCGKGGAGAA